MYLKVTVLAIFAVTTLTGLLIYGLAALGQFTRAPPITPFWLIAMLFGILAFFFFAALNKAAFEYEKNHHD